jgi:hypothetical protein
MLELQRTLNLLSERIVNKDFTIDKYNNRIKEFAPFNLEFKAIIADIPDSFYFDDDCDSDIMNRINYKN